MPVVAILKIVALLALTSTAFAQPNSLELIALKEELGLSQNNEPFLEESGCHLILTLQGSSLWEFPNRMKGWTDVPLSDTGREEVRTLSRQLAHVPIHAIYCSDFQRAQETAAILAEGRSCPVIASAAFRGEAHGKLEGMPEQEYRQDPHFKKYKSLSAGEQVFFSVGEGGESKADVARRMIPFLQRICAEHRGETVLIVTHGGNIKFLNYLMGDYTDKDIALIPHGTCMWVDSDGSSFFARQNAQNDAK